MYCNEAGLKAVKDCIATTVNSTVDSSDEQYNDGLSTTVTRSSSDTHSPTLTGSRSRCHPRRLRQCKTREIPISGKRAKS